MFINERFVDILNYPKEKRLSPIMSKKENDKIGKTPKEPNPVQQRFLKLMAFGGYTEVSNFEKYCGLGNGYYNGIVKTVADRAFLKIQDKYPNLSQAWLNYGIGEMFVVDGLDYNSQTVNPKDEVRQVETDAFMEVSVLTLYSQAGYLRSGASADYEKKLEKMLVPKEYEKGNFLVIELRGDSMDDGTRRALCEGDKLLVKEVDQHYWEQKLNFSRHLFVICTREDGVVCKEVIGHNEESGTLLCHSWNPYYNDYEVKLEDVLKVFFVKKIVERRISF